MTDPMSTEELQACRERAEAATAGPWEVRRADDVMGGFDYFVEAGPMTVAVAAEDTRPHAGMGARRDAAFIAHARVDVPRLLAALDAAQRETAATRHAALFAAGVHGGPGAWRWASDPTGTTLDDTAAWERLLGEMRARTAEKAELEASLARGECQSCGYAPCMCDYQ